MANEIAEKTNPKHKHCSGFYPVMLTSLLIALAVCILAAVIRYYVQWFAFIRRAGLKGQLPVPFFGHMVKAVNPGVLNHDRDLLSKYGKVVPYMMGWRTAFLVADPEILKQIQIREFSSFHDRASPALLVHPFSLNLLQLEGDRWKRIRTIATPTFTSGKLKTVFPLIAQASSNLMVWLEQAADNKSHVNLRKLYGTFTASTISSLAFGLDLDSTTIDEQNHLIKLFDDAIGCVSNRSPRLLAMLLFSPFMNYKASGDGKSFFTVVPRAKIEELIVLLERVYKERKNGIKRPDFFQLMMDSKVKKGGASSQNSSAENTDTEAEVESEDGVFQLSKDELFGQASIFLFAGYETTMTALSYTTCLLAQYPEYQEACFDEICRVLQGSNVPTYDQVNKMTFLEACLKESMRLYTPIRRFFRECTQSTEIGGIEFRKGDTIIIPAHAIHRMTEFWGSDADSFNPHRFIENTQADFIYQSFGAGQRSCIGERLALIEAKTMLANALCRFRFVPGELSIIPPKLTPNTFISRSPHDLLMKVESRKK